MAVLVASKQDMAGMNIAGFLSNVYNIGEDSIKIGVLPETKDLYIFLSKHKSESGKATLTAHFPGNFGKDASYGGEPIKLSISYPSYHKEFMKHLWKLKDKVPMFHVVTEPTHHGPTKFDKPVMFVEIGSGEKEWKNEEAGRVIAEAVKKTIEAKPRYKKIAIAFGGGHYSDRFTKEIVEGEYAIGHIAPKYVSDLLDEAMMDQMAERCAEKVEYCLIDWKGMNNKEKIVRWAKNKGLKIIKV